MEQQDKWPFSPFERKGEESRTARGVMLNRYMYDHHVCIKNTCKPDRLFWPLLTI